MFITFIGAAFCLPSILCRMQGDRNSPSLLSANATLAIIIDREYMGDKYDETKEIITNYLEHIQRQILKRGGVNIQYYSWTNINIKRDITAIFSIASCSDTWNLFKMAQKQMLLHMAISESDCPRLPPKEAFSVPILTPGNELPQIILDTRTSRAYKWHSAILIYDDSLKIDLVTRVVKALTKISLNIPRDAAAVSLVKLETDKTPFTNKEILKETLKTIPMKYLGSNFMTVVSEENALAIMEVAKSLGLVNTITQWFYVIPSVKGNIQLKKMKRLLAEGDNVSFLYNATAFDKNCQVGLICHVKDILKAFAFALDSAILEEQEIFNLVSDEEWEAIRPTNTERKKMLLKRIILYFIQNGTCDNCTKWEFMAGETWGKEYQMNEQNTIEIIKVGEWKIGRGSIFTDELFPHITHGFRGIMLPVVSFHNPPWQIAKVNASGHVIEYNGLVFDILREISRKLNFTFVVTTLNDPEYTLKINNTVREKIEIAEISTNKIPDSIIGMINSKSAAIGACAFTVNNKGKDYVNYTSPINTQIYTFIVARPKVLSRALLFMSPFTKNTWLSIASAVVIMGPILYFIHYFSPVYEYKGIAIKGGLSNVQNCIWYMYGALLQQGGMHLPYADSARILVGAWWLVVLVISTTYCGNLVAFLTFPKMEKPIKTIEDIIHHRDVLSWSIPKESFFEDQLKISTEPKYKTLYNGKTSTRTNQRRMFAEIEQGKHVYIDWKMRLYHMMRKEFLETDRCDLALGFEEFCDEQIAMIMAQDTPYLEIINKQIKRLHQVGLIQKWLDSYLPKKDRCFRVKKAEVSIHTVNMDDTQGCFFVLFIGFTISLLIILIEKTWNKYHKNKHDKMIPYAT